MRIRTFTHALPIRLRYLCLVVQWLPILALLVSLFLRLLTEDCMGLRVRLELFRLRLVSTVRSVGLLLHSDQSLLIVRDREYYFIYNKLIAASRPCI